MTDSLIGQWVARFKDGNHVTRGHRVESEIVDRVITRCGRQMHRENAQGTLGIAGAVPPCRRCWTV